MAGDLADDRLVERRGDAQALPLGHHVAVQILDLGPPNCPPKVEISAIFTTSKAGKFKYLIGTSAGPNKHGVLEAKKVGNSYRAQAALTVAPIKGGELKVHAIANGFPDSEAAVRKVYKCGVDSLKAN